MQPDEFWIDTDWTEGSDAENCAYLYCPAGDACSWRSEICGLDLSALGQTAQRHIERAHPRPIPRDPEVDISNVTF